MQSSKTHARRNNLDRPTSVQEIEPIIDSITKTSLKLRCFNLWILTNIQERNNAKFLTFFSQVNWVLTILSCDTSINLIPK